MAIPGFTALASLRNEKLHYEQKTRGSKEFAGRINRITPAQGRISRYCYPCMSLPDGSVGDCCVFLVGV